MTLTQPGSGPTGREWGKLIADISYIKTTLVEGVTIARSNSLRIAKLEQIYNLVKWITSSLIAVIVLAVVAAVAKKWLGI